MVVQNTLFLSLSLLRKRERERETSRIYEETVQHTRYSPSTQEEESRENQLICMYIYTLKKKPRFSVNPEETRWKYKKKRGGKGLRGKGNKNRDHTRSMQRTPFSIRTHDLPATYTCGAGNDTHVIISVHTPTLRASD